jgi:Flp pilus assembly CpaF family ATPase
MPESIAQIGKKSSQAAEFGQDEQQNRLEAKLKRELGEIVLDALADERTEDIVLNPDSSLWVKRMGGGFACAGEMPATQAVSAMNTIAAWKKTVMNHEKPILETELPIDGSRFEGIISPVVRKPIFAIRLRPKRIFTLNEYEESGILTQKDDPLNRVRKRDTFAEDVRGLSHAEVIRAAVAAKKNILTVGATGSGKTTFVNAVLDVMAQVAPHDRVISIEDTTELQCAVRNYVDLRAVGSVSMLDCLRACMRLNLRELSWAKSAAPKLTPCSKLGTRAIRAERQLCTRMILSAV